MPAYENLAAVAKAHGVSKPAVSKWKKHAKWPCKTGPLNKAKIDRFVTEWIKPNRNTSKPPVAHIPSPVMARAAAAKLDELEAPKTPEDVAQAIASLEWKLLKTTNAADAQLYVNQIRGLEKLHNLMKQNGDLVSRSEIDRGRVARINAVKSALLPLPRALAPALVGLSAEEIEAVLYGEAVKICGEFARD